MDNRTIIQQSIDYIEENLQTEISAAELAEIYNLQPEEKSKFARALALCEE